MSIPVVTMPQQGPIATRPRREGIYDSEGWANGSAITAKLTIFRSSTSFAVTLGLTKTKGRDHNMDGPGGQLSKGQALHWYVLCNKIRPLAANLQGATIPLVWDVVRRIRESTWCTFYFGNTPYLVLQTWMIPEGCGVTGGFTNHNAITLVSQSQAELDRQNGYDVTLNGMPQEITQLESFSMDVEASGVTPTSTVDLYVTTYLKGVLLKGLVG